MGPGGMPVMARRDPLRRLRQVLPQVPFASRSRAARPRPLRRLPVARDPRAHHSGHGAPSMTWKLLEQLMTTSSRACSASWRQRPQLLQSAAWQFPGDEVMAHGRALLPGQGVLPADPLHDRQGRLHWLPCVLLGRPAHRRHQRRAQEAPRHDQKLSHQVRHLKPAGASSTPSRSEDRHSFEPSEGSGEHPVLRLPEAHQQRIRRSDGPRGARLSLEVPRRESIDIPGCAYEEGMAAWERSAACDGRGRSGLDKLQCACITWPADGPLVGTGITGRRVCSAAGATSRCTSPDHNAYCAGALPARPAHAHRHPPTWRRWL